MESKARRKSDGSVVRYYAYDPRARIAAVFEKRRTWDTFVLDRGAISHPNDAARLDLSTLSTEAGIRIGTPVTRFRKLFKPATEWGGCGVTMLTLMNSCDSTSYRIVDKRVEGIIAGYGGC